jgi:hypothetical protein
MSFHSSKPLSEARSVDACVAPGDQLKEEHGAGPAV